MTKPDSGGPFVFRVSDAFEVPLRGWMLRLRRLEGRPSMRDLATGRTLRIRAPDGAERTVVIRAHAVTAGRPTQQRLDTLGELDVIIAAEDAVADGARVDIGWTAAGPA